MDDRNVLYDCVKLVLSMLDRSSSFTNSDKDRIDAFVRQLVPFVFAIPNQELAYALMPAGAPGGGAGQADGDDLESLAGASEAGTSVVDDSVTDAASSVGTGGGGGAASTRKGGKKAAAADLRKKVLKNAGGGATPLIGSSNGSKKQAARKGSASPAPRSRGTSPTGTGTAEDVSMSDPLPTVASLSTLITPEVEAEIAAHRAEDDGDSSAVPDSSREASAENETAASARADMAMVERAESEVDGEMTDDNFNTDTARDAQGQQQQQQNLPEIIVPLDDRPSRPDTRRQWNTFANSTLYSLVRLLQVRVDGSSTWL
jgi:paired amphipathic helix protein Sin3a